MSDECPYEGCSYDLGNHRPYARKRNGVPSVTQVAAMLDNGRARSFSWAAAGIAATHAVHHSQEWYRLPTANCNHQPDGFCVACRYLRSQFDREWKAKANLGTHVHHLALQWARGEEAEQDATTKPYLDGLERFYFDYQPEWLFLEHTLAGDVFYGTGQHEQCFHYRGSFDFIARTRIAGVVMGDIKTSGLHPQEQTLQLAGYASADWITDWLDGQEIQITRMPDLDAAGCLFLTGDGDYRMVWLPVDSPAVGAFGDLVRLHHWSRRMDAWYKAYKEMEVDAEALAVEAAF